MCSPLFLKNQWNLQWYILDSMMSKRIVLSIAGTCYTNSIRAANNKIPKSIWIIKLTAAERQITSLRKISKRPQPILAGPGQNHGRIRFSFFIGWNLVSLCKSHKIPSYGSSLPGPCCGGLQSTKTRYDSMSIVNVSWGFIFFLPNPFIMELLYRSTLGLCKYVPMLVYCVYTTRPWMLKCLFLSTLRNAQKLVEIVLKHICKTWFWILKVDFFFNSCLLSTQEKRTWHFQNMLTNFSNYFNVWALNIRCTGRQTDSLKDNITK